jgi:hypothetical protein
MTPYWLRRPFFGHYGTLARVLYGAIVRVGVAMHRRHVIDGVTVYFDRDAENVDELERKVKAALDLIRETAPRDWQRWRQDVRYIECTDLGMPGAQYEWSTRACVLDVTYVRRWPVTFVAAAIVHEATHGRIDRAGILYAPDRRYRIEALCMRAQIAFAESLPGDNHYLLNHLRTALERPWFSDRQHYERVMARLRALGAPEWVARWLQRRLDARLKRSSRPAA